MSAQIKKQVPVTNVYARTATSDKPIILNIGGAGSSKSYSLAQLLIQKLVNEDHKVIGVGRKTFPALRLTAQRLIIGLLKEYGIYNLAAHNKTEHTYTYGSNYIQFFSLDDPEKIKSFEANYLWLEEATEFTYEDYLVLKMRLRAPTQEELNRFYLTCNPVGENSWIAQKLAKEADVEIVHSTYHDNPFCSDEYIKILEDLINQDQNFYRIYVLGEWGKLENLIYKNYQLVDSPPEEYTQKAYGLDFGFVNPTALIAIYLVEDKVYLEELIYQTRITNADLIELLKQLPKADIYADSSEPQRIEEINRAGFNIYPALKDVKLGIDIGKRRTLYITKSSANLIKEIRGYQYKKNKDNQVLEEPVKFNDHACDAFRYALAPLAGISPNQPFFIG